MCVCVGGGGGGGGGRGQGAYGFLSLVQETNGTLEEEYKLTLLTLDVSHSVP